MKHSEIKQKIIETASSLFYENGYNASGINEIIAKSGIAKATLYNHFKSKEDICLAYLQFKNTTFLNELRSFCEAKPKDRSRILGLFDYLQSLFKGDDFNGCWCIKTASEIPKDNDKIREEIQLQKNLFIKLISDLIDDTMKKLETSEKKVLTRRVYLLYESAVAESQLHRADWPIREAKSLCEKIIN